MDTSSFWKTATGVFIGVMVLFTLIVITQTCIFSWSPQLSDDDSAKCKYAIVKFLITSLDVFSWITFWFLVITAGYWFIFFKLENNVYVLLPSFSQGTTY